MGSKCSNADGADGSTSPILQRKLELDKVCLRLRSPKRELLFWRTRARLFPW